MVVINQPKVRKGKGVGIEMDEKTETDDQEESKTGGKQDRGDGDEGIETGIRAKKT
jgi:hypothetical protein